MNVSVLGIVGSPRMNGSTRQLVDEVLRGASKAGAVTDRALLAQQEIGGCRGCNACAGSGICIQQDDMPALLKQMGAHDVWVLGTPIYWLGPTAQFKAFVDRWYAPWSGPDTRKLFDARRAVLVTSMESSKPDSTAPTVEMLRRTLEYLGVPLVAHVAAMGMPPSGRALLPDETLQLAYRVGQGLLHESSDWLATDLT